MGSGEDNLTPWQRNTSLKQARRPAGQGWRWMGSRMQRWQGGMRNAQVQHRSSDHD
ncbi:MAG: hypothetical protein OXI08_11555 [Cyanobacteria bacterium MAG IRC4_bin_6]|nr:hypothetical protein [Cyanobacteria bacterium MAG IRC4_bin_6]